MRLTDASLKALRLPPAGQRYDVRDDAQPGLVVRVSSTGVKTFAVYRRLKGHNPVRITIGRWNAVSLRTARSLARREVDALASGTDLRPARRAAKAKGLTVRSILEEYLHLHARAPQGQLPGRCAAHARLRTEAAGRQGGQFNRRQDGRRMASQVRLTHGRRQGGARATRPAQVRRRPSRPARTGRQGGDRRAAYIEAMDQAQAQEDHRARHAGMARGGRSAAQGGDHETC